MSWLGRPFDVTAFQHGKEDNKDQGTARTCAGTIKSSEQVNRAGISAQGKSNEVDIYVCESVCFNTVWVPVAETIRFVTY